MTTRSALKSRGTSPAEETYEVLKDALGSKHELLKRFARPTSKEEKDQKSAKKRKQETSTLKSKPKVKKEAKDTTEKKEEKSNDDCKREVTLGAKIGQGNNGVVYLACNTRPDACKLVVKVQPEGSTAQREIDIHTYVQSHYPRIVPQINFEKDYWTCEGQSYMIMERFKTNLSQLAKTQGGRGRSRVLTKDQVLRMFAIVAVLDLASVIHADLGTSQFLWDESKENSVVVTDFGFSGLSKRVRGVKYYVPVNGGWTANSDFGCSVQCEDDSDSCEPINAQHPLKPYLKWMNTWQLEFDLLSSDYEVQVENGDRLRFYPSLVPQDVWNTLLQSCTAEDLDISEYLHPFPRPSKTNKVFNVKESELAEYVKYYSTRPS